MTVQEYLTFPDELRKKIRDKENKAAFLRRMMEETHDDAWPEHTDEYNESLEQAFRSRLLEVEGELGKDKCYLIQVRLNIAEILLYLPTEEREVLDARYLKHMTWKETAEHLGFSKSRCCRLHKKAIAFLQEKAQCIRW